MYRAIYFTLLTSMTVSAQAPGTLIEAAHCSVEKKIVPDEMKFPLRLGYEFDGHSLTVREHYVVFLPIRNQKTGLVVGLASDHQGHNRTYYINNNAGFTIHAGNVDFTPDAPLGGLATQAAIIRGVHSAMHRRLYNVSRRDLERKIPNLHCVSYGDPPLSDTMK